MLAAGGGEGVEGVSSGLELIHFYQRTLTKRQLEVLRIMAAHQHEEDGEILMEGRSAWIGDEQIAPRTVWALARATVITPEDPGSMATRWHINSDGVRIAKEGSTP